jgi:hypothetical protein
MRKIAESLDSRGSSESHKAALASLSVGEICHAAALSDASVILLVTKTDVGRIFARRVTTQQEVVFDRITGQAVEPQDAAGAVWIDCLEPLPETHLNALTDLDHRYRFGSGDARFRLTEAEQSALLFVDDHVAAHGFEDFAPRRGQ